MYSQKKTKQENRGDSVVGVRELSAVANDQSTRCDDKGDGEREDGECGTYHSHSLAELKPWAMRIAARRRYGGVKAII